MARAPPLQGGCRGFKSLWAHVNKPTANELAEIIEVRYPKSLAVEWDAVGFVTNNSNDEVNNILLTIDVNEEVVAEAIEKSIDLIISHHPLILDPEEISDIQSKRIQIRKRLEEKGIALYVAHTNADIATGGVNDSLAISTSKHCCGSGLQKREGQDFCYHSPIQEIPGRANSSSAEIWQATKDAK